MQHNSTTVLTAISAAGKPQLRKEIDSPPSPLMKFLCEEGLLSAEKVETKKAGRPPVLYSLTAEGVKALAHGAVPEFQSRPVKREDNVRTVPTTVAHPATRSAAALDSKLDVPSAEVKKKSRPTPKQRLEDLLTGPSGHRLILANASTEAGYPTVEISIEGQAGTYTADCRYGSWQFNDPNQNNARRDVLPWVAKALSAFASRNI